MDVVRDRKEVKEKREIGDKSVCVCVCVRERERERERCMNCEKSIMKVVFERPSSNVSPSTSCRS